MTRGLLFAPVLVVLLATSPGRALEHAARRIDDDRADAWSGSASTTLRYYNICTGWIWIRGDFDAFSRFGIAAAVPAPGELTTSWHHFWTGVPAGWGFTGEITASVADLSGCPTGSPLASQVFLPVSGWNMYSWSTVVPQRFVLSATLGVSSFAPLAATLDHPAAVAGGPPACGTCYPVTRTNHSFDYGTSLAPLCPPQPFFFDGTCHAEFLWDVDVRIVVGVEPATWAQVKALYR